MLRVQRGDDDVVSVDVYDASGHRVAGDDVDYVEPGVYFVRILFWEPEDNASVAAAWGNEEVSTIQNEVEVTGIDVGPDLFYLGSLFAEDPSNDLAITLTDTAPDLDLVDGSGNHVSGCSASACSVTVPCGIYFVRLTSFGIVSDLGLTASWSGTPGFFR